jgi:hypothetical protein
MVAVAVISQGLVVYDWITPLKRFAAEVRVTCPFRRKYCALGPTDMTLTPIHDDAGMLRLFITEQMLAACPPP